MADKVTVAPLDLEGILKESFDDPNEAYASIISSDLVVELGIFFKDNPDIEPGKYEDVYYAVRRCSPWLCRPEFMGRLVMAAHHFGLKVKFTEKK